MIDFLCILVLGVSIAFCVYQVVQIVRAIKERKKARKLEKEKGVNE